MSLARESVRAYLGLGANLGDREARIRAALAALDATPGIRVVRTSALRETEPVGGPPQGPYLNGVAELETTLPPHALLAICQQCERDAGRTPSAIRDAPRPLDLDVLAYGDEVVDTRELVVPHPRVRQRGFVLEPLAELGVDAGAWPHVERPEVVRDAGVLTRRHQGWRRGGCEVGVVPTMGALHAGHVALLQRARAECDRVTATIFVNPLQFERSTDLDAYPRDFERDLETCRAEGADVVFAPAADAMYPSGFASRIAVGVEALGLEGASRPGHFEGVATVVAKLLIAAPSSRAYFGQKDAQQLAVVERLVRDLGIPVEIRRCPIVREPDGLALSSRNVRLGPCDREAAAVLFRALAAARAAFAAGMRSAAAILAVARAELATQPRCAVDYVELRREGDLHPLEADTLGEDGARLLVAGTFDGDSACVTRLIDNVSLARGEG